jgi:hypothetical protein
MRILAAAILLALAGCGDVGDGSYSAAENDNHGYGWNFDVVGATGLRLRYTPVFAAGDQVADPAFYEKGFAEVQRCTGLSAPAPSVIIVARGTLEFDDGHFGGLYYNKPSLIALDESIVLYRHEMIHYLLDYVTGDLDPKHTSDIFKQKLCESDAFTRNEQH